MMNFTTASLFVLILSVAYIYINRSMQGPVIADALNESYDYIIVGAGSSGSVLANRLTEDGSSSVLLLEAGGLVEDNPYIDIPAAAAAIMKSENDWGYYTEPQKHACFGMNDQSSYWPSGRVLGGSSSVNWMLYVRGSRHDYDSWAAEGCRGWSYRDVLPYFLKSEGIVTESLQESDYHNADGPLTVSEVVVTPLMDYYLEAGQEMGYNVIDYNGHSQIGFSKLQNTIKSGRRWSTYRAFLEPAMSRNNLHVSVNSVATQILTQNKQAKGVTFVKNGRKYTVLAKKEVILSAGTVSSPKLLMLSGIGRKRHLKELGIKVVADLPVGENLQDHLTFPLVYSINQSYSMSKDKVESTGTLLQYLLTGTGYLSSPGPEGVAFVYSDGTEQEKGVPANLQLHFFSINIFTKFQKNVGELNLLREVKDDLFSREDGPTSFTIFPALLHPKSRGTVLLRSIDPFDHPLIDPHYLENSEDINTLLKAIEFSEKLASTKALRRLGPENYIPTVKPCRDYKFRSEAFWKCYIRHLSLTIYHPTSTCRMGAADDPTAVVDSNLRVRGVGGLRVVDASVMRNSLSGNTNAPSIMIAEKAADIIRGINSVKQIQEKLNNGV